MLIKITNDSFRRMKVTIMAKKLTPWSSLLVYLLLWACTRWQPSSDQCDEHDPLLADPSLDSSHVPQI